MKIDPARRAAILQTMVEAVKFFDGRKIAEEKRLAAEAEAREWDAKLNDCWSAFRLFGVDVRVQEIWTELWQTFGAEAQRLAQLENAATIETTASEEHRAPAQEAALEAPTPRPLKVWKIVRDFLREHGESGARAADVRAHVEREYGRKLHDKTVGMTLYRLSKRKPPVARRVGQTWFFVPPSAETKSPGSEVPGLGDLLS